MAGTRRGGLKAAQTIRNRNPNFYSDIGKMGGAIGRAGGFGSDKVGADGLTGRERARLVGALGGKRSKRGIKQPVLEVQLDQEPKWPNATEL